jgi:hypothetical protein
MKATDRDTGGRPEPNGHWVLTESKMKGGGLKDLTKAASSPRPDVKPQGVPPRHPARQYLGPASTQDRNE